MNGNQNLLHNNFYTAASPNCEQYVFRILVLTSTERFLWFPVPIIVQGAFVRRSWLWTSVFRAPSSEIGVQRFLWSPYSLNRVSPLRDPGLNVTNRCATQNPRCITSSPCKSTTAKLGIGIKSPAVPAKMLALQMPFCSASRQQCCPNVPIPNTVTPQHRNTLILAHRIHLTHADVSSFTGLVLT